MCDEAPDFKTFRLGLFGLDKLHNPDRTVDYLADALPGVFRVPRDVAAMNSGQRWKLVQLAMWHRGVASGPGEPGFAGDAPVRSVDIRYPDRSTPIFGFNMPWWGTFFIVSMLAAVIVRPFLKVQF